MPVRPDGPPEEREPARRADALRNHERILAAAGEAFVTNGPTAPLDDIAKRAGVGPATLYRNFPDRTALLRAVALDIIGRVAVEAEAALAEEPEPIQALARYMHRALDLRISAVMPAIVGEIDTDEELLALRDRSARPVLRMMELAQERGQLRTDIAFGDIGSLLGRLSRPLPGLFTREVDIALAHRHLDLVLDGLRVTLAPGSGQPLPGPTITFDDLQRLGERPSVERPSDDPAVGS